ncbi:MAG: hypothetical protein FWF88_05585 [Peptococcaceae bacterium]|nr:hypothetical protein [Peptococcaceae bacterium]
MKSYNRFIIIVAAICTAWIVFANMIVLAKKDPNDKPNDKPYNIEANRLVDKYQATGEITDEDINSCQYINDTAFYMLGEFTPLESLMGLTDMDSFFDGDNYFVRPLYRDNTLLGYVKFRYADKGGNPKDVLFPLNFALFAMFAVVIILLLYLKYAIIRPLNIFKTLPETLAKGDFTTPVTVSKQGRFFGQFLWGLDMLRETLLSERQRVLAVEKEKAQTALSLPRYQDTPWRDHAVRQGSSREPLSRRKQENRSARQNG